VTNRVFDLRSRSPLVRVNVGGVRLAYRRSGHGERVLAIHGSWDDHRSWDLVADSLRPTLDVTVYDRRGHSASTAPPGQGSITGDVDDAVAVIEALGLAPVHLLGHSYGASIAMLTAVRRPDVVASLFVHEPPLFGLLADDAASDALVATSRALMGEAAELIGRGEIEHAARTFIDDVAFGTDSWDQLLCDRGRATMLINADTWLDQTRDPARFEIDVTPLRVRAVPMTLSVGTATLPWFAAIVRRLVAQLPDVRVVEIEGAGHGAHLSHGRQFADAARTHYEACASPDSVRRLPR